ncbi:hypothetical protein [Streptomyces kaempferi]|uniref:SAM-dependent methyltransferase n=1 Tax=Streptomyces kaempferi TaxID=333725 RepID=A0ABW3XJE2_9ACTN
MTTPSLPTDAAATSEGPVPPSSADFVFGGRNVSTGQHIAGLLNAGQLESVGTPRKLPQDIWPDVDPAVVQEIWDRGAATGWRAAQYAAAPRFYRDELTRLQGQLREAGFEAMGSMVARSLRLVSVAHPADDDEPRGH